VNGTHVRLLGPVDAVVEGTVRAISGGRRKAVLAVLALHPGRPVSTDRLVEYAWGDRAPSTAAQTVRNHVAYLREVLGSRAAIVARDGGYALDLPLGGGEGTANTDVGRAESLIVLGEQAADPAEGVRLLRSSLALWRGPSLVDVADGDWLRQHADRLDEWRLRTVQTLVDLRLALGEHAGVVPELERLTGLHPYRENLHRQLMLALYRAGRQAEALSAYQRLRRAMNDELGLDPSPDLRELEAAILRQDSGLRAPSDRPAQLPPAARLFAGRAAELERLDEIRTDAHRAVVIVAGTAGVGKTTLALRWAHAAAAGFPDGQIYLNLRGFDADDAVVGPAEGIRGLLEALRVPMSELPVEFEAQAARYRAVLAGRRTLIVLDNARDEDQVRPLLAGGPGSLVLVTSRNRLIGLIATEGAYSLNLDLLTAAESRLMLEQRLGVARVAGEPRAVEEIIGRCAGLPLALAVAAARGASYTSLPLAEVARQLRGELKSFEGGDRATDVRVVLSWSYRTLRPAAARVFRLVGWAPGPDISVTAVAHLADRPVEETRSLLAELTRVHLMTESVPGRYSFHDLLRAYARELSRDEDGESVGRLLDHYLRTAHAAALLLYPRWDRLDLGPAGAEPLDDAAAWFAAEQPTLLAAVEWAAANGWDAYAWQLAWVSTTYLLRRGNWDELTALQRTALAAAERLGDHVGQGHCRRAMAMCCERWGRLDEAAAHYRAALVAYAEVGQAAGQASAHSGLAEVIDKQGRPADALPHAEQGLELFRIAGDHAGQAHALNAVGWCHTRLGDHARAVDCCSRALTLLEEVGDRDGQASTWDSLGEAHRGLGEYARAIDCYERAVEMCRQLGDRYYEADSLNSLGDTHQEAGRSVDAQKAWQQSLDILIDLDHPDAGDLWSKLQL